MSEEFIVSVQELDQTFATTGLNPVSLESVSQIGDVDTRNIANGSVLVYKSSTNKWTSTINLDEQNVEGGEF